MRVLIINKFLHRNGGSETYIFKLGEALEQHGHEVQYFGMEHEGRCVGNRVNAYTSDMDFHGGSKLSKLTYPIKTIYSSEARKKLRLVLDDFQPDVCHLNNFNYQLTPSMIMEIHNADFPDAHAVCGTIAIRVVENWNYKCCDSCTAGTWNQFCGADNCSMDYEENKVVRVFPVSE